MIFSLAYRKLFVENRIVNTSFLSTLTFCLHFHFVYDKLFTSFIPI